MTAPSRTYLTQIILIHLGVALILNLPALAGKVPLPVYIVNTFPPWEGVPEAIVERLPDRGLGDVVTQIYPWRVFAAESLTRGRLPLWNPSILGGTPFIANAQSAVFYPPNWLYVAMPAALAWTLLFILRTALAGIFATVLARSLGATPIAAIGAGIVFTACGFMTVWRAYPMGDAAIWLPLACFATLRLAEHQTAKSVILAAISLAMPMLAGHPETAAHIALTATAFGVFQWFRLPSGEYSKTNYVVLFTCAAVLSLGLAAAQVLPTLEWLRHISMTLGTRWPPRPPAEIIGLLSRDLSHHPNAAGIPLPEGVSYAGFITLVLAGLAWRSRRFRSTAAFLTGIAIVALGIVYGIQPFHWVSTVTPVLSGLKNGRLLLVVDLSLAMLAALGLSTLEEKQRKWRTAATIITLLLAADLITYSYGFVPFVSSDKIFPPSPVYDFLRAHSDPSNRMASADIALPANVEMMYGSRSLTGYDVALKTMDRLFRDYAVGDPGGIVLRTDRIEQLQDRRLDMMAVKYVVVSAANEGPERLARAPDRFRLVHSYGSTRIFENVRANQLLSVIPLSNVETLSTATTQFERVRSPEFDPTLSAVVSYLPENLPVETNLPVQSGVSAIEHSEPGRIRATVTASEPSLLVLSETKYPGWTAKVDGQAQQILPADYALMAIVVPAGTHEVLFEFESLSVWLGIGISLLTVLVCVALWWKGRANAPGVKLFVATAVVVLLSIAFAEGAIGGAAESAPSTPFELSRKSVVAGKDSYTLKIESLAGKKASIRYSLNGGTAVEFTVPLDSAGEIRIDVPDSTPKGTYRMLAFRQQGATVWTETDRTIVVR